MKFKTRVAKCLVLALVLCATAAIAQVAPTSVFQLDGQTALNNSWPNCLYTDKTNPPNQLPPTTCDYWNLLNGTGTPGNFVGTSSDHWDIRSFLSGATGLTFTQGSKDIDDPQNGWHYSANPTPDKDTITNGYSAVYTAGANGDTVLILGAERYSINGDANIGAWFFQQDVHIDGSGGFVGHHMNNDVFLVSSFTGGGVTPTISVYIWNTACKGANKPFGSYNSNDPPSSADKSCANANLEYVSSFSSLCYSPVSGQPACGVTNQVPIFTSWPSASKNLTSDGSLPAQTFFSGGIDLTYVFTNILGQSAAPCFSSWFIDTRASQSLTAASKHFLSGGFPECHISVTKTYTCSSFNADGTYNMAFEGDVKNDGGGTVYNVTVKDSPVGGSAVTYSCGQLNKGQTKHFPSSDCPQPANTSNTLILSSIPATNLADASATTALSGGTTINASQYSISSDGGTVPDRCKYNPTIDVTKSCVTAFQSSGTQIAVRVDYTGRVTNTGQVNLSNVHVDNDVNGATFNIGSLAPGASKCYTNNSTSACPTLNVTTGLSSGGPTGSASYMPSSANAFGLTAGRVQFTDTVTATGTPPSGPNVTAKYSASCVICPNGSCPTQ